MGTTFRLRMLSGNLLDDSTGFIYMPVVERAYGVRKGQDMHCYSWFMVSSLCSGVDKRHLDQSHPDTHSIRSILI